MRSAGLEACDSEHSNYAGSNLSEANLTNFIGNGCNFENANLSRANLRGGFFHNANFTGCDLKGTQLVALGSRIPDYTGTTFVRIKVDTETSFRGAEFDSTTYFKDVEGQLNTHNTINAGWGNLTGSSRREADRLLNDASD